LPPVRRDIGHAAPVVAARLHPASVAGRTGATSAPIDVAAAASRVPDPGHHVPNVRPPRDGVKPRRTAAGGAAAALRVQAEARLPPLPARRL